jgi:hypothetical protein
MIYADRAEGGRGALLDDDQSDLMMALEGARLAGRREKKKKNVGKAPYLYLYTIDPACTTYACRLSSNVHHQAELSKRRRQKIS